MSSSSSSSSSLLHKAKKKAPKDLRALRFSDLADFPLLLSREVSPSKAVKLLPLRTSSDEKSDEKPDTRLLTMSRSLVGNAIHRITVGTYLTLSSNGAGYVNAILAVNTIASLNDFASLALIFDEYFVLSMKAVYQPNSRYNYLLAGLPASNVANLPMGYACLQHASPTYSTLQNMANNPHCKLKNTGDPFTTVWKNIEDPNEKVVVNPSSSFFACQSWCETSATAAAGYTGNIQYLVDLTGPTLPVTARVGGFLTTWDCLFRCRE